MSASDPKQKLPMRAYVGGFGTMMFAFGLMNLIGGQEVPWGYQQTGGLIMAILGILLFGIARFILK